MPFKNHGWECILEAVYILFSTSWAFPILKLHKGHFCWLTPNLPYLLLPTLSHRAQDSSVSQEEDSRFQFWCLSTSSSAQLTYVRLIFLIPTSLKRERHVVRALALWSLLISLSLTLFLMLMCMHVQVCMCVGGEVCICVWVFKVNTRFQPQILPTWFFETWSLTEPGASQFNWIEWPTSPRDTQQQSPQDWDYRCI